MGFTVGLECYDSSIQSTLTMSEGFFESSGGHAQNSYDLTQDFVDEKNEDEVICFGGVHDLYKSCDSGSMHASPPKMSRTKEARVLFTEVKTEPGLQQQKVTPNESDKKVQKDATSDNFLLHNIKKRKVTENDDPYRALGTPPYTKCRQVFETIRDGVLLSIDARKLEDSGRIRNKNIELACNLQNFIRRYHRLENLFKKYHPDHVLHDDQRFITAVMDIRDQVLAVRFRVDVLSERGLMLAFRAAQVEGTASFLCELIEHDCTGYLLKCFNTVDDAKLGKKQFRIYPEWKTADDG